MDHRRAFYVLLKRSRRRAMEQRQGSTSVIGAGRSKHNLICRNTKTLAKATQAEGEKVLGNHRIGHCRVELPSLKQETLGSRKRILEKKSSIEGIQTASARNGHAIQKT